MPGRFITTTFNYLPNFHWFNSLLVKPQLLPEPDLKLGGTPYWERKSVEKFCDQEKIRLKSDSIIVGNLVDEKDRKD
jgi:hypothetical protein